MRITKLYLSLLPLIFLLFGKAVAQNQTLISGGTTAPVNFPATGCLYGWTNNTPSVGLPASGFGNIPAFTAINTTHAPIVATITVTPITLPSYAYIADMVANGTVSVISDQTRTIVATIPVGSYPYSIAISPDSTLVYVVNTGSASVSVISKVTNTVVATIPVGTNPQVVAFSRDGRRAYVADDNNIISVIDPGTNTVINRFYTAAAPGGIVVSADGSKVYVSNNVDGTVSVIDTLAGALLNTIAVGNNPVGLALNPAGTSLYVANSGSGTMSVINTTTNTVTATIPISTNAQINAPHPQFITLSADGSVVYVACNNGAIGVFNAATNAPYISNYSEPSPQSIGLTPDGLSIYVVSGTGYLPNGRVYGTNYVDVSNFTIPRTTTRIFLTATNPQAFGNFITTPSVCTGAPVTFTITVNPKPIITASAVSGIISTCVGSASASPNIQQFTVSGVNLTADITATAPAGFEISLAAGSGYTNSITLSQANAVVNGTVIYVRSAASAPAGNLLGNVVLSSADATTKNVSVFGEVNALPTVNAVANQTVVNGAATAAINFTGTGAYTWVNNTPGIGLAASGSGNIPAFKAVNTTNTPIVATITATPTGSLPAAYIPDMVNNGTVSVVTSQGVVATIPVGSYPEGIAVNPGNTLVYVLNNSSANVSVISTATNTVIATIPVANSPQVVAFSRDGTRAYVVSNNNTISVIDPATNTVINSFYTTGAPHLGIAVSADGSKLYVSNNSAGTVSVIDAVTGILLNTITVGINPSGLALNQAGTRLFVANTGSNTVSVINTATNTVIASPSVIGGPYFIIFSNDGSYIYVESNSHNVTVIDASTYTGPNGGTIVDYWSNLRWIGAAPDGYLYYVTGNGDVAVINYFFNLNHTVSKTAPVFSSYPVAQIPLTATNPQALGNFIAGGSGCIGAPTTFTITVNPSPNITTAGAPQAVNTTYGTASASSSFTILAASLTTSAIVTPPTGFELSTDNVNFSNTLTVSNNGTNSSVPVYIRLASATAAGTYSGNIVLSRTGSPDFNVAMPASIVSPAPLTITANDDNKTYGTALTNTNNSTAFGITAGSLQNGNTITAVNLTVGLGSAATAAVGIYPTISPTISTGSNGFLSSNYNITYQTGNIIVAPAPLTIAANNVNKPNGTVLTNGTTSTGFTANGLQNQETIGSVMLTYGSGAAAADPPGSYPGSITPSAPSGGTFTASNYSITYINGDITVQPPIVVLVSGTPTALSTVYGTVSTVSTFTVSGSGLSAGILVTPPSGFELSTDNNHFYSTLTIGTGGTIASTTVYIRLMASSPVGSYAGNILLGSTGANASLAMPTSTVNAAALTITADDKTKFFGTNNPILTASYQGFVNNETAIVLSTLPTITTTATKKSAVGQYPITANGAVAPNYNISYLAGTLTIMPLPLAITIPNTFTPNGDGYNDVWSIPALAVYSNNNVSVFDRWGTRVFYSSGYGVPWDGTFKGSKLPVGSYYYIIKVQINGQAQTLSGSVTIIR